MNVDDIGALIHQGAGPRDIRGYFRTKHDALQFYANTQASRFTPKSGGKCCICQDCAALDVNYNWKAFFRPRWSPRIFDIALLLIGVLRTTFTMDVIEFTTTHGFCLDCWKVASLKLRLALILDFLGKLLAIFGLFMTLFGAAGTIYYGSVGSRFGLLTFVVQCLVTGIALLAVGCAAIWGTGRLRIPESIRGIAKSPFQYWGARRAK
jgi:hypothetical protein